MKKIIALILVAAAVICLGACGGTKPGEFEQSEISIAQREIISTFGISAKDSRIVAYENGIDYVKYIIVKYSNGVKTEEYTHYFYLSELSFEKHSENIAEDEGAVVEADKLYICQKTNAANTGDYAKDKELIEKDHHLK